MSTSIQSRIIKTEPIRWKDLKFIQDENFKEWSGDGDEKLLQSLVKYNFIDPFKVWENNGELFCLDGKHRWLDLQKAEEKGIEVPEMLEATFIHCTDTKEAAELVLIYSAAYARITQQGFYNHMEKYALDFPEMKSLLQIPNLELEEMKDWFLPPPDENEIVGLAKNNPIVLKITFKNKDQIDKLEPMIKQLLQENCPEAFYSVGGGEL